MDLRAHAAASSEIDLHGYPVWQAREVAREFVKVAWEAGHGQVTLIHGARAADHPWSGLVRSGYGGIKWSLRSMLRNREFEPYARGPRSRKHHTLTRLDDRGEYVRPGKATVRDWLEETWLPTVRRTTQATTATMYEQSAKAYVRCRWRVPLQELTRATSTGSTAASSTTAPMASRSPPTPSGVSTLLPTRPWTTRFARVTDRKMTPCAGRWQPTRASDRKGGLVVRRRAGG